jgi:hypothetical protein
MSEVKVNKISPRTNCGTVQLGDSGDTITIPVVQQLRIMEHRQVLVVQVQWIGIRLQRQLHSQRFQEMVIL